MKPLNPRRNNLDLIRLAAALQVALVQGSGHLKIGAEAIKWMIQILSRGTNSFVQRLFRG